MSNNAVKSRQEPSDAEIVLRAYRRSGLAPRAAVERLTRDDWVCALAYAAGECLSVGAETAFESIWRDLPHTRKELRAAGVDAFDINRLKKYLEKT